MKQKLLNNEAISELGLLSASYVLLQAIAMVTGSPFIAYQQCMGPGAIGYLDRIAGTAKEICRIVNTARKLNKVVFAGYEAALIDEVFKHISASKSIIVIPNSPTVNYHRLALNYSTAANFYVQDIYQVWEATGHDSIVFVPYFEMADGTVWIYRYCSPIVNEQLHVKARTTIGIRMLNNIRLEQGYDTNGSLQLLTQIDPKVFQSILYVDPNTQNHELNYNAHSA